MIELHTDYGIGFKRIGSEIGLPDNLIQHFRTQEQLYPSKNGRYLILAVNYGGNDEILRGINTYLHNNPHTSSISEKDLSSSMDLGKFPQIELVIRTK